MYISSINPSFKGYDAAPLKRIYLEDAFCDPIYPEMAHICKKENVKLVRIYDFDRWTQDDKAIIEKDGKPHLIGNGDICDNFINQMKNRYNIKGGRFFPFLDGGNTFLGKFPDGQKWMITGVQKDETLDDEIKNELSQVYNIPSRNIFPVPKPDFHIDLGIRPIGYPDVLVNDPELAEKELEKFADDSEEYKSLKSSFDAYKGGASFTYDSCDDICSALEKIGFNPIRIAGVFYNGINFMNAVVNKNSAGKISYITNSSDCDNHIYKKLQANFEAELKRKVPQADKIYFVKGIDDSDFDEPKTNYMINSLRYKHGGIHCMSLEEPDFQAWG